jgi:transcriptional regulator with XRE-family HTH domain
MGPGGNLDDEMNGARFERLEGDELAQLRWNRRLSQAQLAELAGLAESTVYGIEAGDQKPTPSTVARLLAALHATPAELARLRDWLAGTPGPAGGGAHQAAALGRAAGRAAEAGSALLGRRLAAAEAPVPPPRPADRAAVPALLKLLEGEPWAVCRALIAELPRLHSWALCEHYCAASEAAAASDPRQAARLAVLALRVARHAPGTAAWRSRLLGDALFRLANGRRVLGRLPAGEAALDRAQALWAAGAPADPGLLDRSRVLDIAASFRHAQRRLGEARSLLDQAVALAAPGPATARLLLKQAKLHEELGDIPAALATVEQAAPHLDDVQAPRHRLVYGFNRAEYLRQLGRQAEAEALLPAVRALSKRLANVLDGVRLRWLEARMSTTGGRPAEATAAFREVRDAFAARGIAYDLGLVTLELAAHLLEQGETAAVRTLAAESEAIFKAQQVDRERYGAILVFCRAAEREAVTLELVRDLLESWGDGTARAG